MRNGGTGSTSTRRRYQTPAGWATAVRRVAVVALVGWAAWLVLAHRLSEVCHGQVADDSTVVRVCRPLAVTDLPVLAFLLVLVLLLLPDLSEIDVAGILTLKRAVEEVRDDASSLRDEVADLRVTTIATANQRQSVNVSVGSEVLRDGVERFRSDGVREKTGTLTATEELGGSASLAFNSALDGLVAGLFGRFHDVSLVGWVRAQDGSFAPRYGVGDVDDAVLATVAERLDPSLRDPNPFATSSPGRLVVTAYAPLGPDLGSGSLLVGALTVVAGLADGDWGGGAAITESLAIAADAAAGAYALLLTRLLGEPPTMVARAAELPESGERP